MSRRPDGMPRPGEENYIISNKGDFMTIAVIKRKDNGHMLYHEIGKDGNPQYGPDFDLALRFNELDEAAGSIVGMKEEQELEAKEITLDDV